ncbi:hypothetical protein G7Y89_g8767 [Cudoniella acicularis]|uniref:Protein kinase domain-containing protein n=1 Tax=Cudoniella acicularis TaxID=354080 RepID=A0A8H4W0A5_9HELO|nr:hypothetical protein G7Y89_g8767 [Cudoniella acicularis]
MAVPESTTEPTSEASDLALTGSKRDAAEIEPRRVLGPVIQKKTGNNARRYRAALKPISDKEIFPVAPTDTPLTIVSEGLDVYIKRPGIHLYEETKGNDMAARLLLSEILILEQISKSPHPHIVRYYGCRAIRGLITGIVLERLEQTLLEYVTKPSFLQLDKVEFFKALESAVEHLHGLGLAYNDINPQNIMLEEDFRTSKKHGTYDLEKVRE